MFTMTRKNRKARGARVRLEELETRQLMSTLNLVVSDPQDTSLGKSGNTLRQAINLANTTTDSQVNISFAANLTTLDLSTALPNLSNNINISGTGQTIQRNPAATTDFSIFTVNSGETVSLSGLTISGGNAVYGGGVDNLGSLTVANSIITNNVASGNGGAIDNSYDGASLTVTNSSFTNNSASGQDGWGGAIENEGIMTVTDSVFTGNSATFGGAVFNETSANNSGTLSTIDGSTFRGNSATGWGGAITNSHVGTLSITNTAFTDNQ